MPQLEKKYPFLFVTPIGPTRILQLLHKPFRVSLTKFCHSKVRDGLVPQFSPYQAQSAFSSTHGGENFDLVFDLFALLDHSRYEFPLSPLDDEFVVLSCWSVVGRFRFGYGQLVDFEKWRVAHGEGEFFVALKNFGEDCVLVDQGNCESVES